MCVYGIAVSMESIGVAGALGKGESSVHWYHIVSVIAGFVVGAGVLGLPIKFGSSGTGFLPGALMIVVVGLFQALTALFLVKVVVVCGRRELTGYTLDLLGRLWWFIVYLGVFLYVYGALVAYVKYGGIAFNVLSHGFINYYFGALIYWAIGLAIVYYGVKALSNAEAVLVTLFLGFLVVISTLCFTNNSFHVENLLWMNPNKILAGFGVAMFAYAAHFAIPSIGKYVVDKPGMLAKAVVAGFLIPMTGYILWSAGFMGLLEPSEYHKPFTGVMSGQYYSDGVSGLPAPVAVAELGKTTPLLASLGYIFGFMTTFTSFLVALYSLSLIISEFVRDTIRYDIGYKWSLSATALAVLATALAAPLTFIDWLDLAGSIGAPLFTGIVPSLMIIKLGEKACKPPIKIPYPKLLAYISIAFYTIGMIYYIITLI